MITAVDVGTSSVRATLYDDQGHPVAGRFHQVACPPRVSHDGGVEHDAERLLGAVAACLDGVLRDPATPPVTAVAVTTFWHGLLGLDAAGHALTPVLTWADTRPAEDARRLREATDEAAVHARTGCHLHASYWPAKLAWLRRARPDEARRAARWGSIGEFLEVRLLGEGRTSVSMASGTGLLDQESARWWPEALAMAGVDEARLFPLCDVAEGRHGLRQAWAGRWPALRGAAWFPAVGDGAASNVGSGCTDPARIALNVGTSAALRVVTPRPAPAVRGLWRYRLDRRRAITGGATSEGGNVFAWCRSVLRLSDEVSVESALASASAGAHGLTILPFLAGERAPGWRDGRRAVLAGLTLDTTAADILRAALEAVALRLALVYGLLGPLAAPDHRVVASGAALARSPGWARIIADALGRPLELCAEEEATSRGAALLALEALGSIRDVGDVPAPIRAVVEPDLERHALLQQALARQQEFDARLG